MAPRKPPKQRPEPPAAEVVEHVLRPPGMTEPAPEDGMAPREQAPQAYAYADPDAQVIGRGATGDMGEYPECPLCLAHGGGGHGSNCPNAGKDPANWVSLPPDGWSTPERAA